MNDAMLLSEAANLFFQRAPADQFAAPEGDHGKGPAVQFGQGRGKAFHRRAGRGLVTEGTPAMAAPTARVNAGRSARSRLAAAIMSRMADSNRFMGRS